MTWGVFRPGSDDSQSVPIGRSGGRVGEKSRFLGFFGLFLGRGDYIRPSLEGFWAFFGIFVIFRSNFGGGRAEVEINEFYYGFLKGNWAGVCFLTGFLKKTWVIGLFFKNSLCFYNRILLRNSITSFGAIIGAENRRTLISI